MFLNDRQPLSMRFTVFNRMQYFSDAVWNGPRHKGAMLPLGALEPTIAQIQHRAEEIQAREVAVWHHQDKTLTAAMKETASRMSAASSELDRRERNLAAYRDKYKRDHDGLEPAATKDPYRRVFWLVAILSALAELPLMIVAFDQLPLPEIQRDIAALCVSAAIVCLAHFSGKWIPKPGKTLWQRLFGAAMIMALILILAMTARMRSDVIRKLNASPNKKLEVFLQHNAHWRQNV